MTVHGGSSERGRSLGLSSAVVFVLSTMLAAFLFFCQRSMYWLPFLKCCSPESGHAHFEALVVASLLRGEYSGECSLPSARPEVTTGCGFFSLVQRVLVLTWRQSYEATSCSWPFTFCILVIL